MIHGFFETALPPPPHFLPLLPLPTSLFLTQFLLSLAPDRKTCFFANAFEEKKKQISTKFQVPCDVFLFLKQETG